MTRPVAPLCVCVCVCVCVWGGGGGGGGASVAADPAKRRRLGTEARRAAVERFGLLAYAGELARHLHELGADAHDREGTT